MLNTHSLGRGASMAAILAMTLATTAAPAVAQPADNDNYGPPPGAPPDEVQREQGPPRPPSGYSDRYDQTDQARREDEEYSRRAQDWAARYCYRRSDNAAGGAIIGGVLGALLGGGIAGRGNHTSGALIGGAVGAVAGASVGASSTSPGCPPGMVVREDAPPFYGPTFVGGYVYDAPPDYRPWIWYGGRWVYRPYPYHRYWYHEHHHWR
jgi:hypothetical protein